MNLQQLEYTLEIYKQGSINKAAQALFVTQPTLSIAIKELEKEIGFVIFERNNKGISPTPAGMAFINTIHYVLFKLEEIKAFYINNLKDNVNIIRISSSRYSFVTKSILQYYNNTLSKMEKYTVTIEEHDCQQVINDILSKKSDIGIIHTNAHTNAFQLNYFRKKDIEFINLFESVPYLIFRKDHPLSQQKRIKREDLIKYPQIRISSSNVNYYDETANFNLLNYGSSERNFFISSRSMIYPLLLNSDAVFFGLTKYNINDIDEKFTARPLDDQISYYFYAIMLKEEKNNTHINEFLKTLMQNVSM